MTSDNAHTADRGERRSSPERRPGIEDSVAQRRQARRGRAAAIRKRAIAAASCTFVLSWGVIFAQLVSGNDPALAHKAKTTTVRSSSRTASSAQSSSDSSTSEGSSGNSSTGSTSGESSPGSSSTGSVTTRQS
jgi:cytoskeletal protein RodZ